MPSFFAQRTRPTARSAIVKHLRAVRRDRYMKSLFDNMRCCAAVRLSRCRFLLRRRLRLCDDALEAFDLLAQLRLLLRYLLLLAVKRRGRFARTPKHPHHRLAIQAKRAMAMAPKRISGKV